MSLGEFDIINRYFARRTSRTDVLLGIGDDAAVVDVPDGHKLVVAMDTIVEGVHFPAKSAAVDIGYRALAVNLSDLAAMGAEPAWMTLSLSLPDSDEQWIAGFSSGLFALAQQHNVALIGGDTVKGPLVITVQVAGWVEADRWLTRSGARPGDLIFVSGVPGEAAAGLTVVQNEMSGDAAAQLRTRFLRPEPRIALGRHLRTIATAAMDISDGLLTDLDKLCVASGCGARIDVNAIPKSGAMQQLFDEPTCLECALAGGDDYELLFTIAPTEVQSLLGAALTTACTQIGVMTANAPVECLSGGKPIAVKRRGYDHFDRKDSCP